MNYVKKVEQLPEEHRNPAKLCPKTGLGIAKRMMVIKNDTIRWMFAKMRVRRSLLPNLQNFDVLSMLKFSLWNQDIFPKDAFDELRKKYPGKASLDAILDISPKLPEDITKQIENKFPNLGTKSQGFNQSFSQRNKGNTRRGIGGDATGTSPRTVRPPPPCPKEEHTTAPISL